MWLLCFALWPLVGVEVSVADGPSSSGSMHTPEELELNWVEYGFYDDNGVEAGEPVTPGSDSYCDESEPWTLDSTHWYSFIGTGEEVVLRLDGSWNFGMVVYQAAGAPTVEDGLYCLRGNPRRVDVETEPGQRYLVQVGDWDQSGEVTSAFDYRLNLATPSANGDRARAVILPFGQTLMVDNFGSHFDEVRPHCVSGDGSVFFGGRGAWAKVETGAAGTIHVSLAPEEAEWVPLMISAYAAGSKAPFACSVGPFGIHDVVADLQFEVAPGAYWVQLMPAMSPSAFPYESPEERWELSASFSPDLDVDNDGHARPSDCDDAKPSAHPGATDLPDNGVDENCDGSDARKDSDGDGVPDFRDRCPKRSSRGVDADRNGCGDPQQLPLVAQIRMTLTQGRLHVTSLVVKTDSGADLALSCDRSACRTETRRVRGKRTQLRGIFSHFIPNGAEVTIAATKRGHIGVSKRYRLSSTGLRLVGQRCTKPGRKGSAVPCE